MSPGRVQKVAAIAAAMSAFAASAQPVSPDGLGPDFSQPSLDTASASRLELSRVDALDRWRLTANSSRASAQAPLPAWFPRFSWASGAVADVARANLAFDWQRRFAGGTIGASAFASGARGDFGDVPMGARAFQQRSRDSAFGGALAWKGTTRLFGAFAANAANFHLRSAGHDWQSGATDERGELDASRRDHLGESAATLDLATDIALPRAIHASVGTRYDSYRATVRSESSASFGAVDASLAAPRVRVSIPLAGSEAFASFSRGLVGDDARSLALIDPRSNAPVARLDPLASAENFQVGFRGHWLPGADTSVSMFRTKASDELFLSGESAITDFSRPTVRRGVQGAVRYEPSSWLSLDLQAASLTARFADGAHEYVPGAAGRIVSAAATVRGAHGWSGTLLVNSLGKQGESLAAMGASTFVNAHLTRRLAKDTRVSLDLFNVFGRPLRDVDYLATTRLWSQPPTGDANLPGPAEPRGVRLQFRVRF